MAYIIIDIAESIYPVGQGQIGSRMNTLRVEVCTNVL